MARRRQSIVRLARMALLGTVACFVAPAAVSAQDTATPAPQIIIEVTSNLSTVDDLGIDAVGADSVAYPCQRQPSVPLMSRFDCADLPEGDYAIVPSGLPDHYHQSFSCSPVDAAAPSLAGATVVPVGASGTIGCKLYASSNSVVMQQWGSGFDLSWFDVTTTLTDEGGRAVECRSFPVEEWPDANYVECEDVPDGVWTLASNVEQLGLRVVERRCMRQNTWSQSGDMPLAEPEAIPVFDDGAWQVWGCSAQLAAPLVVGISSWEPFPDDFRPLLTDSSGARFEACASDGSVDSELQRDYVFCGSIATGMATVEVLGIEDGYAVWPLMCGDMTVEIGVTVGPDEIATPRCGLSYEPTQETLRARVADQESSEPAEADLLADDGDVAVERDVLSGVTIAPAGSTEAASADDARSVAALEEPADADPGAAEAGGRPSTGVWIVVAVALVTSIAAGLAIRRRRAVHDGT